MFALEAVPAAHTESVCILDVFMLGSGICTAAMFVAVTEQLKECRERVGDAAMAGYTYTVDSNDHKRTCAGGAQVCCTSFGYSRVSLTASLVRRETGEALGETRDTSTPGEPPRTGVRVTGEDRSEKYCTRANAMVRSTGQSFARTHCCIAVHTTRPHKDLCRHQACHRQRKAPPARPQAL